MSLKQDLQTWADALQAYDQGDLDLALALFGNIADSSKIQFNIGLIQATTGDHASAVDSFEVAIGLDRYLAVAYFQAGVSNFLLERWAEARRDFDDAFAYMRSNLTLDYQQLGLNFRLYSCEVLFNRGLATIYNGNFEGGMQDLEAAQREKQTEEHSVIDDCYNDQASGYTVFSIPTGILYRPSDQKLKNLASKNYLGAAKLIAATDSSEAFVGFAGTPKKDKNKAAPTTPGLNRSQTSAARLERSLDVDGVASPLRRRPTLEALKAKSEVGTKRGESPGVEKVLEEEEEGGVAGQALSTMRPLQLNKGQGGGGGGVQGGRAPVVRPMAVKQASLPTPPPSDEAKETLKQLSPLRTPSRNQKRLPGSGQSSVTPSPIGTAPGLPQQARETSYGIVDAYFVGDEVERRPTLPSRPGQGGPRGPQRAPTITRNQTPDPPRPEGQSSDRVANWALQASGAPPPSSSPSLSRGGSTSDKGGPSANAGSGVGRNAQLHLQVQTNVQRSGSVLKSAPPARPSYGGGAMAYYGDEGVYEGTVVSQEMEMTKVRVKLRFGGEVRGMSIGAEMGLDEFGEKVRRKFGGRTELGMKYRDGDETQISIVDSDDWETAMDEAREAAKGRTEGKLEILLFEL